MYQVGNMIKRIGGILLVLSTFCKGVAQIKVLDNLDLKHKTYQLYFFNQKGKKNKYSISSEVSSFVIEDRKKLMQLKNTWIGEFDADGTMEILECGYDYKIYIVEKGKSIIGQLLVNIDCGQVIGTGIGNSANFKGNPFSSLTIDGKIYGTALKADKLKTFRKLHQTALSTKGVYYPRGEFMNWVNYDGKFRMMITAKDSINHLKNSDEIIKDIKSKYPKERFAIDLRGYSSHQKEGYILCDRNFYEKIIKDQPVWEDFKLSLGNSVWKPWDSIDKRKLKAIVFSNNKRAIKRIKKALNKIKQSQNVLE